MALDGILDHSMSETAALVGESTTYETEMRSFAAWCASDDSCALHGQNVTHVMISLVQRASISPVPAPGCLQSGACYANVTGEDILFNSQGMLSLKDPIKIAGQPGWNGLAIALAEAAAGNATHLSSPLATSTVDPLYADTAIMCNDWTTSSTKYSDLLYKKQLTSVTSPITRGATQFYAGQTTCIGFPKPIANPPRYANVQNGESLPIFLAQSYRDPECSPEWAVSVQQQIEKSVLVWRDGDGHTSYNLFGDSSKAIEAYLVNMTLPMAGAVYGS